MARNPKDPSMAKARAVRDAKEELIQRHTEEYEQIINEKMTEAGFVARTVSRTVWEIEDQ